MAPPWLALLVVSVFPCTVLVCPYTPPPWLSPPPEAVLPLTQATIYLSLAEKSNLSVRAYKAAREDVVEHGALPVPLEIRNAVTKMMKEAGYGRGYRYPHDEGGVVEDHDSYLPEELRRQKYVRAGDVGWEAQAARRLASRRKKTEDEP